MQHTETERKFLVKDCSYTRQASGSRHIVQGYICQEKDRTVRVRISGEHAWLTIKGQSSKDGTSRYEWEQEIPAQEAEQLIKLCRSGVIDKTRYIVPFDGHIFEVDEFHGTNSGLIVAEIELKNETESFSRPEWLGKEVTGDGRDYNSCLVSHPFSEWDEKNG